jgi:hypothetical protein
MADAPDETDEVRDLRAALHESLRMQSHYAILLNMRDGGERKTFWRVDEWMNRLREVGVVR